MLEQAEILKWLFLLGVLVPVLAHVGWNVQSRRIASRWTQLSGARVGFYLLAVLGVFALSATLFFSPGPDPAGFADVFLLHLGYPPTLVGTVTVLVAACLLLTMDLPEWLEQWVALSPRQQTRARWAAGGCAFVFGLVALGVISYYALGWTWWVGSTQ